MLANVGRPVEPGVLEEDGLHILAHFDANRQFAFVRLEHGERFGPHLKSWMTESCGLTRFRERQANLAQLQEDCFFVHLQSIPAY